MYMIWTALNCLVQFVDSIIWNGNTINRAPVWCDFCKYSRPLAQASSLTNLCSYPHQNRHCCRMARLHSLHHSPPLLYRLLHRRGNHEERGALLSKIRRRARSLNIQPFRQKRREVIIDLLITVGLPVLEMGLGKHDLFLISSPSTLSNLAPFSAPEFIVAGHRFNIIEDYGCSDATWNTPLAFVLVYSWPVVIGLVSAGYGCKFTPDRKSVV